MGVSRCANIIAPLFVPANRPERFAKAAASGADAIILDLEDAVAADDKEAARAALSVDFTNKPVIVRVNAMGTRWHVGDMAAVRRLGVAAVMIPKAESAAALMQADFDSPLIALVETVLGVASAREIARCARVERLAFGSVDYAADLGCDHDRDALAPARSELLVASRLAHKPAPFDGVTTDVRCAYAAREDARHARALGFGGKLCIHPKQIEAVFAGFMPSAAELDWAQRVLAAGDGATTLDGAMIDAPVRARARSIRQRAGIS